MSEKEKYLLTAGVVLGLLLAIPALVNPLFDDAYIHARLVENLFSTGKPIFNDGEVFKAGSSTGYVLLIAALSKLFGAVWAIRIIEFIAIAMTVTGLAWLLASSQGPYLKKAAVLLAGLPFMLLAAYGGMESSIVCALMTGAVIAHLRKAHWLVLLLVSLCVWFRFETIVLLALFCFYYWRSDVSRKVFVYTFPLLILFCIELALFGSIIPHAAKVKTLAYDFPLITSLRNALMFRAKTAGTLIGVLFCITMVLGLRKVIKNRLVLDVSDVFLFSSGAVLCAWIVGRSLIFFWYYTLLVFPFCLAVFLILCREKVADAPEPNPGPGARLSMVVAVGLGLAGLSLMLDILGLQGKETINLRVERYLEIGSGLYGLCPDCKLVTSEIGGLGYAFRGKVYDGFGLGDPEAVRFHPMKVPEERRGHNVGAIPPGYVSFRDPEFIVSMPVFSEALRGSGVLANYFTYDCLLSQDGKLTAFRDNKIQVFSKMELPAQVAQAMRCHVGTQDNLAESEAE